MKAIWNQKALEKFYKEVYMSEVEEDGDEIFTKLSDGCFRCSQWNGGKPVSLEKYQTSNGWIWRCPVCGGSYGKVNNND